MAPKKKKFQPKQTREQKMEDAERLLRENERWREMYVEMGKALDPNFYDKQRDWNRRHTNWVNETVDKQEFSGVNGNHDMKKLLFYYDLPFGAFDIIIPKQAQASPKPMKHLNESGGVVPWPVDYESGFKWLDMTTSDDIKAEVPARTRALGDESIRSYIKGFL